MTFLARLLAILCTCCWSLLATNARAELLQGVNVAALAAARERLYVGGFDDGLYVVERSGGVEHVHDAALSPHINALAWSEQSQVLWLGTARGLTRCHMAQVRSCSRLGPTSPVHALYLGSDDSLVAGGDAGLVFVDAGTLRVFGKKQGAPFRSVWALAASEGALFVGATNGLFFGNRASFAPKGGPLAREAVVTLGLPDDWVTALLAVQGRLYVGTYNAGLVRFRRQGAKLSQEGQDADPGYVNPTGLLSLGENQLVIATMDGLRHGALGETRRVATRTADVTAVVAAPNGGFFVGTRRGVEQLSLSVDEDD